MNTFKVSQVIDGDTFDVVGGWEWKGKSGTRVRPTGYNAREMGTPGGQADKDKLVRIISDAEWAVQIDKAYKIDRGRLVCDVYVGGRNLAEYFV